MFGFILELLNGEGNSTFFDLQKGGRKANNAQKEKRRLARKRSRAAKREREREAAKAAKLPPRMRKCVSCGREFASRKTTRRHTCPNSKVVRKVEKAAGGAVLRPNPPAKLDKPSATITPLAPSTSTHRSVIPAVTRDSQGEPGDLFEGHWPCEDIPDFVHRQDLQARMAEGWVPLDRPRKRVRTRGSSPDF